MGRLSKLKLISGRKIIRGKGQLVREGIGSESEYEEIEIEMREPECKVLGARVGIRAELDKSFRWSP